MARRRGQTWYVAGINGTDQVKTLVPDLRFIPATEVSVYADSPEGKWSITSSRAIPAEISCQPRGGFVLVVR